MPDIVRTEDEIQHMIDAMKSELASLPAYNAFGESNEPSIKETKRWISELASAKAGQLVENPHSEAYHWLIKCTWSPLEDFLGG